MIFQRPAKSQPTLSLCLGRISFRPRSILAVPLLLCALCNPAQAQVSEPVVTSVFDMEEDAFAAEIIAVEGLSFADCAARDAVIPARGQHSLAVEIGATTAGAGVVVDLRGRDEILFDDAQRVGVYVWINDGDAVVCLRLRDAAGRVFESSQQAIKQHKRWQRLTADLHASKVWKLVGQVRRNQEQIAPALTRAAEDQRDEPLWPIAITGFRVIAPDVGRQTVFLDDVEVEHNVAPHETVRGLFRFNQPIQLYAPGATIGASLFIENLQRRQPLNLTITLSWQRADGAEIKSQKADMNLPPSSPEYRSRQSVDFSQKIDEPGLYRLVARIQSGRWQQAKVVETGLAVMQSNRGLPRGRSTLFAIRSAVLDDPRPDQELELQLADEIGAELFVIETPWRRIESKPGTFNFAALDPIVTGLTKRNITPLIALMNPPTFDDAPDPAKLAERRRSAFKALAEHFGPRVRFFEAMPGSGPMDAAALQDLQQFLVKIRPDIILLGQRIDLNAAKPSALPPDAAVAVSRGSSIDALRLLNAPGASGARAWKPGDWWLHDPPALDGIGTLADATALLQHYFTAASAGVAGLMCYDLRDDTNDPHHPERMRGLVRRDFSPKGALLGFANAAALIGGAQYAGPVPNTPAGFDSFAFQGPARQLAALFPRSTQNSAQVLSVIKTLSGELHAFDAERRAVPLIAVTDPPIVSAAKPLFIELRADKLSTDFSLSFAPAWLRIPASVACGTKGQFAVELTAPAALRKSYIEVVVPKNVGLKSSVGTRAIKADAGQVVKIDCDLTREAAYRDIPARISVNVSIEGKSVLLPIDVQPMVSVTAGVPAKGDQRFLVGRLRPLSIVARDPSTMTAADAGLALLAGFSADALNLDFELPPGMSADSILTLSLTVEGGSGSLDLTVRNPSADAVLSVAGSNTGAAAPTISPRPKEARSNTHLSLAIPAKSLGLPRFDDKMRLLIASRMEDRSQQSESSAYQLGGNADSGETPHIVLSLGSEP